LGAPDISDVTLTDIAGVGGGSDGVTIANVSDVTVSDCRLEGYSTSGQAAVRIHKSSSDITVDGITAVDCLSGIRVYPNGTGETLSNVTVRNVDIHDTGSNTERGLWLQESTGSVDNWSFKNIDIINIGGSSAGHGIVHEATDVEMSDVTIQSVAGYGSLVRESTNYHGYTVNSAGNEDIFIGSSVTGIVIDQAKLTGTITDNGTATVINGEAVESAGAETPQQSYPTGTLVRFTDSGDGSGTGTYLVTRGGGTIQVASSA
jgi:hypothetical protein